MVPQPPTETSGSAPRAGPASSAAGERRPPSLNTRLLIAASIALVAFLGATAAALDQAFRESAAGAARDRLQGHVYTLLAAANVDADGRLFLPGAVPEARFSRPGSGLYAQVSGAAFTWQSESLLGVQTVLPVDLLSPNEIRFAGPQRLGQEELFVLSQGVAWELDDGSERGYTFSAAESTQAYHDQIRDFRRALWVYLGAAGILLLAVQGTVMRWGLRPIRSISTELGRVEQGEHERLEGRYPRELEGLAESINAFIRSERLQLERFRHSLADLAHSLKTPLAVMRGFLDADRVDDEAAAAMSEQVTRMDEIVAYQLKRGGARGHRTLARPVLVAEATAPLIRTLGKLHIDRAIDCQVFIDAGVRFFGDRGDLMEILGNLLENAYKWSAGQVTITASQLGRPDERRPGMELVVEDDGPGIAEDLAEEVLKRGVRGDERVQGHGIGLSVVGEIAAAYEGRVSIGRSQLGGAAIRVTFPGHTTRH